MNTDQANYDPDNYIPSEYNSGKQTFVILNMNYGTLGYSRETIDILNGEIDHLPLIECMSHPLMLSIFKRLGQKACRPENKPGFYMVEKKFLELGYYKIYEKNGKEKLVFDAGRYLQHHIPNILDKWKDVSITDLIDGIYDEIDMSFEGKKFKILSLEEFQTIYQESTDYTKNK